MLTMYLNTVSREWFNQYGEPFRSYMPEMTFRSRDTVTINCCTATPNAGESGVDTSPGNWLRDTSFAGISGLGAMLTADDDYAQKLRGSLTATAQGENPSVVATIADFSDGEIPLSGVLRLYTASSTYETISYTSRSITGNNVTFVTSGTLTNTYNSGDTIDCDQSPLCTAYLNNEASDIANGTFKFDLVCDSERLRASMEYSDTARLTLHGLELLIYQTVDGAIQPLRAFLCETFSIVGMLGNPGYEADPPDAIQDKISSTVSQLLAAGFEVETRENAGNQEFRFRSESAGGDWSEWIVLPPGADGADGADGAPGADGAGLQIDQFGLLSERPASPGTSPFCYFATDTNLAYFWDGAEWSAGVTVTGPEGQPGAAGADGETVVADPAVEFTFMNETYGRCVQLDSATPTMNFAAPVWDVKKIRLRVVSANPDVTGEIILIAKFGNTELDYVGIEVGATPAMAEITFLDPQSGPFSLRRDYGSDNDTLKDGEPVTALILNTELVIAHE